MVTIAEQTVERALPGRPGEQRNGAGNRVDQGCADGGQGTQFRAHQHVERLGLVLQVGLAVDLDQRRRRLDLQRPLGAQDAPAQVEAPLDAVESQALAEDVAEIEGQPARQRLQRDQPEQLAHPRLQLVELAALGIEPHLPGQAGVIDGGQRPVPLQLPVQLGGPAAQAFRVAQALE